MKALHVVGIAVAVSAVAGLGGMLRGEDAPPAAGREYVGAGTCKKCHVKQYKVWEKLEMAKAFDTLKPGEKKEAKEKWKVDPAKDYTQDEKCVKCHTTGYGEPGGYPAIAADWNDEQKKRAEARQGIHCEACHGPGSVHFKARLKSAGDKKEDTGFGGDEEKPKLAPGEINPKPDAATCQKCHNDQSPAYQGFCIKKMFEKVNHLDARKNRTPEELAAMKCGCGDKCECKKAECGGLEDKH